MDIKLNINKRAIPYCKVCGERHYNFHPCDPRQDLKPAVEWSSDKDLAWVHKLKDLKYLGGNSFVQRREWDR